MNNYTNIQHEESRQYSAFDCAYAATKMFFEFKKQFLSEQKKLREKEPLKIRIDITIDGGSQSDMEDNSEPPGNNDGEERDPVEEAYEFACDLNRFADTALEYLDRFAFHSTGTALRPCDEE